jgi:hypothetical protein
MNEELKRGAVLRLRRAFSGAKLAFHEKNWDLPAYAKASAGRGLSKGP